MKASRKTLLALVGAMAVGAASAAPSVEITSVQQQYPWTNTVDIVYNVAGVESETNGYFVVFTPTTSDGKEILDVNGQKSVQVALKGSGVYSTQWFPQTNLQYTACKMTPAVFRGAAKDYMIVDLVNGGHSFEPMATQAASNEKYDTDEYKTTKLILRRIPAGTYYIGNKDNPGTFNNSSLPNSYHQCIVPKDYYVGVFPVTEAQWRIMIGDSTANTMLPKVNVSYNAIRGSALPAATPVSGFAGNLSKKAGLNGFDLPTESMWEVAARAKNESSWPCGDTYTNGACNPWAWSDGKRHNVGLKRPNDWGLYDVKGNNWEIVRDVRRTGDLKNYTEQANNALKPILTGETAKRLFRSCGFEVGDSRYNELRFASCWSYERPASFSDQYTGFRIAWYPE